MSQSNQYVGLDVSLKETSICVIDDADKIVWRGRAASTPEAVASAVKQHAPHAVRIGLESGQLSGWLFHGLKEVGLPVICVDARHAKAAQRRPAVTASVRVGVGICGRGGRKPAGAVEQKKGPSKKASQQKRNRLRSWQRLENEGTAHGTNTGTALIRRKR
jgi:transposase